MGKTGGWMFGRIDHGNVDRVLRNLSISWYVLAGLLAIDQIVRTIALERVSGDLIDPVAAAFAGFYLRSRKSRALAVALLLFGLFTLGTSLAARSGLADGGTSIVLALVMVVLGGRSIPATWQYQARRCARTRRLAAIVIPLVTAVVCAVSVLAAYDAITATQMSQTARDLIQAAALFFPAALVMALLTRRWPLTRPDDACPWPGKTGF